MPKIAFLILFLATGCQAQIQTQIQTQMQAWQRERAVNRLAKIENYHGRYTETGVAGAPTSSEVWFQAPASYTFVSNDGAFLVSEPGTLKMYDPAANVAVVYKNLPVTTAAQAREALVEQFDDNVTRFTYTLGASSKVADHDTIELRWTGRGLVTKGSSQIYDSYSFPLATELQLTSASYSLAFSSIEFNKGAKAPTKAIPKKAIVSEWDYDSKPVTLAEARREIAFTLPKTDLPLVKIIRQKGPIPAFTAFYAKGGRQLSVLVYKSYGVPLSARGVKIAGGWLRPGPHSSSFAVTRDGTNSVYTFTGALDQITSF